MMQSLKQHITQLQTFRFRIVLEGQNPQLFLLPTVRELSAIIIDPDINIDVKYYNSRREIVLESHCGNLQIQITDVPRFRIVSKLFRPGRRASKTLCCEPIQVMVNPLTVGMRSTVVLKDSIFSGVTNLFNIPHGGEYCGVTA